MIDKAQNSVLFKHLFNTMKSLEKGEIDVETAKAQAGLAKQANNLLKYELDRAKALARFDNLEIRNIEELE